MFGYKISEVLYDIVQFLWGLAHEIVTTFSVITFVFFFFLLREQIVEDFELSKFKETF